MERDDRGSAASNLTAASNLNGIGVRSLFKPKAARLAAEGQAEPETPAARGGMEARCAPRK
eukprot:2417521-Rhodomonas_salina.1